MSTITTPVRTSTTRPRITSPSSMSPTLRDSQYSMVSSGGVSTSCCPPARPGTFRSSVAISPYCLLCPLYIYIVAWFHVRVPSGGPGLQLRDGAHHLLGGRPVRILAGFCGLAPLVPLRLEAQRRPEAHDGLARARHHRAPGQGAAAAGDEDRHHRGAGQHGEHARARFGLAERPLGATGALGKDEERLALFEHAERGLERAGIAALAAHRPRGDGPDEPA